MGVPKQGPPPPPPSSLRAQPPSGEGPASSTGERRSAPRIPIEVDVTLNSESHFFAGLTGDISEGGVFVATYRAVPVGSKVDLVLALPSGEVRASGLVRWVRNAMEGAAPGLGVAFENLTDESRARVDAFCTERAPWYYDV